MKILPRTHFLTLALLLGTALTAKGADRTLTPEGDPPKYTHGFSHVQYSGNGKRLLAAEQNRLVVWDTLTNKALCIQEHERLHEDWRLSTSALSADGKRVAMCLGESIAWRSVDDESESGTIRLVDAYAKGIALDPTGARLAVVLQDKIVLYTDDGEQLATLKPFDEVATVGFSPDGRRVVVGGGREGEGPTCKIYDAKTGKLRNELRWQSKPVISHAFSADGSRLATLSYDQDIKFYDVLLDDDKGDTYVVAKTIKADNCNGISLNATATRISSVGYHRTEILDAETGELLETVRGHSPKRVALHPQRDEIAVAAGGAGIVIRDLAALLRKQGPAHSQQLGDRVTIKSLAWPTDGKYIVVSADYNREFSWIDPMKRVVAHKQQFREIQAAVIDPENGDLIAATRAGTPRLFRYSAGNGKETVLFSLPANADLRELGVFGNRYVLGAYDRALLNADLKVTLKIEHGLQLPHFSPDGRWMFAQTGSSESKLWDLRAGAEQGSFAVAGKSQFSPDSRYVIGNEGGKGIWHLDIKSGEVVRHLAQDNGVNGAGAADIALARTGPYVAVAGGADLKVRLYDYMTGELLMNFHGHKHPVRHVAISPDGKQIVSLDEKREMLYWNTPVDGKSGSVPEAAPLPREASLPRVFRTRAGIDVRFSGKPDASPADIRQAAEEVLKQLAEYP